jgi:hypothetical protein
MEEYPDDVEIIWKEKFEVASTLNFDDPIMREKTTSVTNMIVEKVKMQEKETPKDKAVTRNIMKSIIGPSFQESMLTLKEKRVEAQKTIVALENTWK